MTVQLLQGTGVNLDDEDAAADLHPSTLARAPARKAPPEQLCLDEEVLMPKVILWACMQPDHWRPHASRLICRSSVNSCR